MDKAGDSVDPSSANHLINESSSPVDMHILEKSISDRAKSDVENFVAMIETRVHDAILCAMDNLVIPRLELAMKSTDASSTRDPSIVVLDLDQRDFS